MENSYYETENIFPQWVLKKYVWSIINTHKIINMAIVTLVKNSVPSC